MRLWRRTHLGTDSDRATFRTLHQASLATPALREGLSRSSADRAIKHVRMLLGSEAVALTDTTETLAWDGGFEHHRDRTGELISRVLASGEWEEARGPGVACDQPGCPIRAVVTAPLVVEDTIVGTVQAYAAHPSASLSRACEELARWISGQLELAELDASRNRLMAAEVRALRAQISPHFIYNSLNVIASFIRTDPDRARDLLTEFADFTRYSFRRMGEFTTLADELGSIERYLLLEQARFGDRLTVRLEVAPEVLSVVVPFLSIQPLVENAVRHGLAGTQGGLGTVTITAHDRGNEAVIEVEDDGAGEDPETVRRALAGHTDSDSLGLSNVDARLRSTFGNDHGLVVETAPGAGTKVIVRVPKFAPGVQVEPPGGAA